MRSTRTGASPGSPLYRRLLNDAKDSPVTEEGDENQWYGGLLVNYNF